MKKIVTCLTLLLVCGCNNSSKSNIAFSSTSETFYKESICYEVEMKWWSQMFISNLFEELYKLERTESIKNLLKNNSDVKKLNISSNNIKTLPTELFQLENLEALDISNNPFEDLEQVMLDLSKIPKLKLLVISHCGIVELPDNVRLLKNLEGLVLDQNELETVNENIGELTNLRLLSFRRNEKLTDLPKSIGNLTCLQQLDISGAGFTRIREEVTNCKNLKSIIGNASKIKYLPKGLGRLKNLKHLNLGANEIEVLPESIGDLEELEDLSLGSNEIETLPKSISKLQKLDAIGLEYNRFKKFPLEVLKLKELRLLKLHNNNIQTIPVELAKLPKLKLLYVDHEIISDENIEKLRNENPNLEVKKHDALRRAPRKPKRKN